jgi:AraC-like DNA-binding protein
MRLLDRPSSLAILQAQLIRELHFWLLSGRHGGAIRSLGVVDSHAQRVARAVALIRANFAKPLGVEQMAAAAGMSVSSFHEHFRSVTSLTPLQFQKQLRLIEARRMMLADGEMISNAAYAVGYESVTQFTREYARMFGLPPARDMNAARTRNQASPELALSSGR